MKFYKITSNDDNLGYCITWATSLPKAQAAKQIAEKDGQYNIKISKEEVPTDKLGLLAWLKHNIKHDNG